MTTFLATAGGSAFGSLVVYAAIYRHQLIVAEQRRERVIGRTR
ncbi:hypothetical protein [Amycolatopsis sp. SID8362]|nr:hypothetical protein [Amycolatopsis sp. SID8362]